jgi:outer membrane protein TolC
VPPAVLAVAGVSGQQPLSVTPTVAPPVTLVRSAHQVKLPDPLSAPAPLPSAGKKAEKDEEKDAGKSRDGDGEKGGVKKYAEVGPELTLGECIALAVARQPSLMAVKDSAAATEIGYRSLTTFGTVGTIISPDLEIRKQQAKRGLMATSAEYQKLHNEVVQDVTRLYYQSVYAGQQQQLAENVVSQLDQVVKVAEKFLNETPNPRDLDGFNSLKLISMKIGLETARGLLDDATVGREQALAGLREVMAMDARTQPFRIKDTEMPLMRQNVPLSRDFIVELALTRRPELVLAAAGVDAFRLEVYAQGKIPFRRVAPTFASGVDLHSKEVPQGVRTTDEYRPGAILPEMPTQLVGSKADRVCRAMAFARKADAVYEKVRYLVTLEAEKTFADFERASGKLTRAKVKFEQSKSLQKQAREQAEAIKQKDQLLQAEVVAAQSQSDYLKAVQEYLLALAALERVTAGGIRPDFPGR